MNQQKKKKNQRKKYLNGQMKELSWALLPIRFFELNWGEVEGESAARFESEKEESVNFRFIQKWEVDCIRVFEGFEARVCERRENVLEWENCLKSPSSMRNVESAPPILLTIFMVKLFGVCTQFWPQNFILFYFFFGIR